MQPQFKKLILLFDNKNFHNGSLISVPNSRICKLSQARFVGGISISNATMSMVVTQNFQNKLSKLYCNSAVVYESKEKSVKKKNRENVQ